MTDDLFAGLPVSDYERAVAWYERWVGAEPAFRPTPTEAVWELAEHRYLYVEVLPERAGHGMALLFVGDLDERVARIAARGLDPDVHEAYDNGVHKVTYRDPDGNEVSLGGAQPAPDGS